ncbi:MAG: DUF3108 domain-containing protein [Bacteroidia bacterium]
MIQALILQLVIWIFLPLHLLVAQPPDDAAAPAPPKAENFSFTFGEKLVYKVKYSLYLNIHVGEITFEVKDKPKTINGKRCYHISTIGRTYGFYDPFYKVRDRYDSYVHTETLLPLVFLRFVNEGGYKFNESVVFNHEKLLAKSEKRVQSIPKQTYDIISAIYSARNIDYENASVGDSFMINAFLDDTTYMVGVKYYGTEEIKTSAGKFRCLKLRPILIVGRIFKSEEDMALYVTDDKNRIPVRIESGISVGAIVADLSTYEGLRNPMTSKLK